MIATTAAATKDRNVPMTLVGLVVATFAVAFTFGGHPVIAALLLLVAWFLIKLDEDMKSS